MGAYAEGTKTPISRSRDEIEATLRRFGAKDMVWAASDERGVVVIIFNRRDRTYKFEITRPPLSSFVLTPSGKFKRPAIEQLRMQEAEYRRRFRWLSEFIKVLLDGPDSGNWTVEQVLLPFMVLPTGKTVFQEVDRQIAEAGGFTLGLDRALAAPKEG